jgi:SAM-dependent methyltransferase
MQTIDLAKMPLQPEHILLDVGAGQGRHALAAYWFATPEQVIAVDIDLSDVKIGLSRKQDFPQSNPNKHCDFVCADGTKLPFPDASFDAVICAEVLEHLHRPEQMLAEICRVIKPGGMLAISVPRAWPERICWLLSTAYHQVEGGHVRIYDGAKLRAQIESFGFEWCQRHWAHALHTPYWWLRCLFWGRGESFAPVRFYHRLLVWDLMQRPWITQTLEKLLNPILGKSLVLYFRRRTQRTPS